LIKRNFFAFWLIALIKENPLFEKIRNENRFKRIVQQIEEKAKRKETELSNGLKKKIRKQNLSVIRS